MDKIIEIKNLSKSFGDKKVLEDINLYIRRGEFITLLGPSGCGKTTLLRMIAGFLQPDEGSILMDGKELAGVPPHERPLNTVFQRYALFPHLDVYDNIAFGLKLKKVPEEEIEKRVRRVLKLVAMSDYEDRDVETLSGGQQQRIAIARAIVNQPKVLLLDEPLAALDLKMRKDMQIELKEMHKKLGITFIYVTHDQEEALTLSDTVVVLNEGRIQQIGTPVDIYNEPVNCFVADFIGESNILKGRPAKCQFKAKVNTCTFKGVHYEMWVDTDTGYELMIQDYDPYPVGSEVMLYIDPDDIQVMKKERECNTLYGTVKDGEHIELLGGEFPLKSEFEPGTEVKVEIPFEAIDLMDNLDDGVLDGEVHFILYMGNHYHLTIKTDDGDFLWVDTNDIWDKGDLVGIRLNPENSKKEIKITKKDEQAQ